MSFIKKIAGDLLALEVNTIIKANMLGTKSPDSKRKTFYYLAKMYRDTMLEYRDEILSKYKVKIDDNRAYVFRWVFGGLYSFDELERAAAAGKELLLEICKHITQDEQYQQLFTKIRMLERIEETSNQVVQFFIKKAREMGDKLESGEEGYGKNYKEEDFDESDDYYTYPGQFHMHQWNNDLTLGQIDRIEDLEMTPDELAFLYKAYSLGTDQIVLQTSIQIDGDVTSYISRYFLNSPREVQENLTRMHNDSIQTSTKFWTFLFETIVKLAGQSFDKIFSKK